MNAENRWTGWLPRTDEGDIDREALTALLVLWVCLGLLGLGILGGLAWAVMSLEI